MMKRLIAVLLIMIVISFSGCTGSPEQIETHNKDEEEESVNIVLNERQEKILKEMGLPADYDALSLSQKSAIESIESMLCYLEQTYGGEFIYLGYVPDSDLEKEHLRAYPAGCPKTDVVTLYRSYENGQFIYEDNYASVQAKPAYEAAVTAFVTKYFTQSGVKIYVDHFSLSGEVGAENILKNASASVYVFVSEAVYGQAQVDAFAEATKQWLADNCGGLPSSVLILLAEESGYDRTVAENYQDKLREDIFSVKIECAVNSEGEVTVY